jgi:hypothetical protein
MSYRRNTWFRAAKVAVLSAAWSASAAAHSGGSAPSDSLQFEQSFRDQVSAQNIGTNIRELTLHPNFPGSAFAKRNAQWVLQKFREWGWEARVETFIVGSTANARRLSLRQATNIAAIPCLPLSYADAEPLVRWLGGQTVPESWRGALPVTYRTGPGPAQVHLQVAFQWRSVNFYDVIARMTGSTYPNEWVIRGSHRDGWVYGAQDPHSGHSALLEEARVLGLLHKSGWRPKRTIIYASWDGEEQGVIGSTEWMETHFGELQRKGLRLSQAREMYYDRAAMLGASTASACRWCLDQSGRLRPSEESGFEDALHAVPAVPVRVRVR